MDYRTIRGQIIGLEKELKQLECTAILLKHGITTHKEYRQWAKKGGHPDLGGNTEIFQAVVSCLPYKVFAINNTKNIKNEIARVKNSLHYLELLRVQMETKMRREASGEKRAKPKAKKPKAKKPKAKKPKSKQRKRKKPRKCLDPNTVIITGPRGGKYYLTASGRKVYC